MATATRPERTSQESGVSRGDDRLYEVVNGQIVEIAHLGVYETVIASILLENLGPFVTAQALGRCVSETLFLIDPATTLKRRPDLAFVSFERWPRDRRIPRAESWDVVPDLPVEVVSPTNTAVEIKGKIREYFAAKARLVWVIYPDEALVEVYESPTQVRIFSRPDTLDAGAVVPGFQLPLSILFEADTP